MVIHVRGTSLSRIVVALLLFARCMRLSAGVEAEIDLDVEGSGFHRTLIYRVHFKDLDNRGCRAAIYLELPSTLYVNVDEIAELRRQGTSTVCFTGETNVELFAETADRQNVTTCASVNLLSNCTLTIPIHQRYQNACENGGYVVATLPKPKLLLGCRERVRGHRVSKTDLCQPCVDLATKWREIPYGMSRNSNYAWTIPVGDSSLSTFVTCVTLSATIVGTIFIARAIWTNVSSNDHQKKD